MANAGESKTEIDTRKAPICCSQRWNLATLVFFGFLFVYVLRANLSVAIICMVRVPRANHSATTAPVNFTSVELSSALNASSQAENEYFAQKTMMEQEETDSMCGGLLNTEISNIASTGEFDWDKGTQSRILAMYFYGYVFTQIPGGWLGERYGGRRVWGVCQLVSAICALLTPLAARTSVYFVYVLRFVLGLAAGITFPCVHAMFGRWVPKLERSRLVAFSFAGLPVGTILTFSLSALLCAYGFDNGWGSIFYLAGAGNLVWVCLWWVGTADTPSQHKRIGSLERDYILHSIGERPDEKEKIPTPWRSIFTSGPVWAIITAHACGNYTIYTLLTSLPTFMKEVLKFDIKQNGALSALPYLCSAVVSVAFSHVADFLRERKILSTKNTRKLMQCTAFLGAGLCIGTAGFVTCDQRNVAVVIICLCLGFMGLGGSGFVVNHIDLAPKHAGVLFGITNTAATVPGMIAPLVAGALTPNQTAEEWRIVFYICSAMDIFGAVVYGILADGELQDWAAPNPVEIPIDVTDNDVIETQGGELQDWAAPNPVEIPIDVTDNDVIETQGGELQDWAAPNPVEIPIDVTDNDVIETQDGELQDSAASNPVKTLVDLTDDDVTKTQEKATVLDT